MYIFVYSVADMWEALDFHGLLNFHSRLLNHFKIREGEGHFPLQDSSATEDDI